jgi:acyl-CoA hydrolase
MDTPPIAELERLKDRYPDKFLPEDRVFSHVRRGDRIFIGTACGEPQHLVHALTNWVRANPKALFDAEIVQVWTLGVAPYTDEKLKYNFRHNSFFLGNTTRGAVGAGLADYPRSSCRRSRTSSTGDHPDRGGAHQTSLPDEHGFLSLGVSVDIVKAAAKSAALVIAQVNRRMPRVHGDRFLHASEVDFVVPTTSRCWSARPRCPTTSPRGSASTSRGSSRTATPSRWATGACRTRSCRRSGGRSTWASTPSC